MKTRMLFNIKIMKCIDVSSYQKEFQGILLNNKKIKDAKQCVVFKNKYYETYKKGPCIQ